MRTVIVCGLLLLAGCQRKSVSPADAAWHGTTRYDFGSWDQSQWTCGKFGFEGDRIQKSRLISRLSALCACFFSIIAGIFGFYFTLRAVQNGMKLWLGFIFGIFSLVLFGCGVNFAVYFGYISIERFLN